MQIVSFGHRKTTGKDTSARFLANMYRTTHPGSNVIKSAFAIKLYDICYQLYGWTGFNTYEYYQEHPQYKESLLPILGKTVRQILIEIGIKVREVYEATWIDYLLQHKKADLLIISDLRFPNEFDAIKNMGGYCIHIDRPSIEHTDDEADTALANYGEWDDEIINDGTPGQLYIKVQQVCSKLLKTNLKED